MRRYAALLKVIGLPPDRALVLVKDAVRDATPELPDEARTFRESIIHWFVDGYYHAA